MSLERGAIQEKGRGGREGTVLLRGKGERVLLPRKFREGKKEKSEAFLSLEGHYFQRGRQSVCKDFSGCKKGKVCPNMSAGGEDTRKKFAEGSRRKKGGEGRRDELKRKQVQKKKKKGDGSSYRAGWHNLGKRGTPRRRNQYLMRPKGGLGGGGGGGTYLPSGVVIPFSARGKKRNGRSKATGGRNHHRYSSVRGGAGVYRESSLKGRKNWRLAHRQRDKVAKQSDHLSEKLLRMGYCFIGE